jgi:flavodoxin
MNKRVEMAALSIGKASPIREEAMNALVVYDSQYGNTECIAQAIAETLRAAGEVRAIRVDPAHPVDPAGVDVLIVGSPTQGWKPTSAIQSFLAAIDAERLRTTVVACFDTRLSMPRWMTGSAAKVMDERLREIGVTLLAPPESFFVTGGEGPLRGGELERAATWTHMLLETVEATRAAGA